jgi:hypothetical protein
MVQSTRFHEISSSIRSLCVADELGRVRLHRHFAGRLPLAQQLKRGQAAQLGLEEDVERPLARLATRGHVIFSQPSERGRPRRRGRLR